MASLVTASKPPSYIMQNTLHDDPTGNVLEWHDEAVNVSALIGPLLDKHGCACVVAHDCTWGMMKSNTIPEVCDGQCLRTFLTGPKKKKWGGG
jgi:hypothetical protein